MTYRPSMVRKRKNEPIVPAVRDAYAPCHECGHTPTQRELAQMFGLSQTAVGRMLRRETWRDR